MKSRQHNCDDDDDHDHDDTQNHQKSKQQQQIQPQPQQQKQHPHLTIIYILTLYLCCFMVFYIAIFPSSWLIGRFGWTFHRQFLLRNYHHYHINVDDDNNNNNNANSIHNHNTTTATSSTTILTNIPFSNYYFFRFEKQTAVHIFHHLPGAVWALIIPIQYYYGTKLLLYKNKVINNNNIPSSLSLSSFWMKQTPNRTKTIHHVVGYIYITCVFMLLIGVILIYQRKLTIEHFYYDVIDTYMYNYYSTIYNVYIFGTSAWFFYTIWKGYYYIRYKHMYTIHSYWMIRNIGSAIWIILMRNLLPLIGSPLFGPYTRRGQRDWFGLIGMLSGTITILVAEYTIVLLKKKKKNEKENNSNYNNNECNNISGNNILNTTTTTLHKKIQ